MSDIPLGWQTGSADDYSRDRIYSRNERGRTKHVSIRLPLEMTNAIDAILRDPRLSYKDITNFFYDMTMHQLHWLEEQIGAGWIPELSASTYLSGVEAIQEELDNRIASVALTEKLVNQAIIENDTELLEKVKDHAEAEAERLIGTPHGVKLAHAAQRAGDHLHTARGKV